MGLLDQFRQRALRKQGLTKTSNHSIISSDLIIEPPVFVGDVIIGNDVRIGKHSYINSGKVWDRCIIGRYCSLSYNVLIGPPEHPTDFLSTLDTLYKDKSYYKELLDESNRKKTEIGNDVWIGANAFIRKGVKLADGVIVGAGSVVIKDMPAYSIIGGVPARILEYRFPQEVINELLKLKWWNLDDRIIQNLPFNDVLKCISIIKHET